MTIVIRFFWAILVFHFFSSPVVTGAVERPENAALLRDGDACLSLGPFIEFLEDKSGTLTIHDVTSPPHAARFARSGRETLNLGLGDSVYWLRFRLGDRSASRRDWLLEQPYPLMRSFDLYLPKGEGGYDVRKFVADDAGSHPMLPHRNPLFSLPLTAEVTTFHVRASVGSIMTFPLIAQTRDYFLFHDSMALLGYGIYFGFMLTMVLYNVYIFFLFRDRLYLYFVSFIIFFALLQLSLHGFLRQWLFADAPLLDNQVMRVLIVAASLTSLLFSRRFLDSKRHAPAFDRALLVLIAVDAGLLILDMFLPLLTSLIILNLHTLLAPLLAGATGIACYLAGFKPARYYLVARGCFYVSLGIFAVNNIVIYNHNLISWYGMMLGSFLEVLFISRALAERVGVMVREKEKVEAEAVRASSRGLIGEMAAGVAHEVNNPLAGIMLCFQGIISARDTDPERAELITAVENGLVKIRDTMANLLNLTRMTALDIQPSSIIAVINDVLGLCRYQLDKAAITIETDYHDTLPPVPCDERKMGQVLANLILNASHAMPDGGRLTIGATVEGETCLLTVADTGSGIPPEILPRVFEPFFTTKESGKGTGLGLAFCKSIVDAHDGSIVMESTPGNGTVCRIRLPLTR